MESQNPHKIQAINLPAGFEERVCLAIRKAERRRAKMRLFALSTASTASFASCVFFFINLWKSVAQSGFSDYLSLAISDVSMIGSFWKELLASLVESMPAIALLAFLGTAIAFVWSSTKAVRSASTFSTLKAI